MSNGFPSIRTRRVNGVSLAYTDEGQGTPIVFVHGGVSDLRTWTGQTANLADRYRPITYSRRYARPNDDIEPGAPDPIDLHVGDLAGLLDDLDASPAHLVGHSWGGLIVLLLAMRMPERVRSMTLIEPPALTLFVDVPPKPAQILRLLASDPLTALSVIRFGAMTMGPAEKAFRRGEDKAAIEIFGKGVLGADRFAALSAERYAQVWDNRNADKAQILGNAFPPLDRNDLKSLEIPALLLSGSQSPVMFRRICQTLDRLLPRSRLVVVDGASHIVHEDAPAEVRAALGDFLLEQ